VAQTFFVDQAVQKFARLDAIITVVDAKHILEHLTEVKAEGVENESVEQVAFADKILLNKIDLVDEATIAAVTTQIRAINAVAEVIPCSHAEVPLDKVLGIRAFDLSRIMSMDAAFLEDTDHMHDTTVTSVGVTIEGELDGDRFQVSAHATALQSCRVLCTAASCPAPPHDMQRWLSTLLREQGKDIFRSKGVLAVADSAEKVVFQGVHMLMSCVPLAPWGADEPRVSRAVFIGRNLDRKALHDGLAACAVSASSGAVGGAGSRVAATGAAAGPVKMDA